MQRIKLFLLGCCVGAGLIFTGLQYHLVRGHEGFRFVPRTPQQSLGLAYADVRDWGPEQWADRPELTRSLLAHGAADLITSSESDGTTSSSGAQTSTLDQLRSFINETPPQDDVNSDLLDDSVFRRESPADDAGEMFSIPFPDSADRIQPLQELADAADSSRRTNVARSDLSVDDVFATGTRGPHDDVPTDKRRHVTDTQQMREETEALEDTLFPDSDAVQSPAEGSSSAGVSPTPSDSTFQDVTNTLDRRATEALQRAQSGFQSELDATISESSDTIMGYVREQTEQLMPESVSKMFTDSGTSDTKSFATGSSPAPDEIPYELQALQKGFDPFLRP